ncbi:MAG: EamA family transporter [Burkholderiales bacterium]|nr:EamA family transporter [Burkholderiales bacterium]
MTATAFALVITAAMIHASWNILAKKSGGGALFVMLGVLVVSVLYAPIVAVYVYFNPPNYGWKEITLLIATALIHLVYSLTLQRGYQKHDLTVVYPVARGVGPLLSSTFAIVLLGEPVTLISGGGIACIVIGIFILAGGHRIIKNPTAAQLGGVGYGALTGLAIAGYTLVDGYGVKVLLMAPLVLDYFSNVIRGMFMAPMAWRNRTALVAEWHKNGRYALIIGTISPLAYILVLYAMQTAPISSVAPMRELSMVFAAFLGAKLLGEGHRGERLIGSTLMALGVWGLMHG